MELDYWKRYNFPPSLFRLRSSLFRLLFITIVVSTSSTTSESDERLNSECSELGAQAEITKIGVVGSCREFVYCVGDKAERSICPKGFHFNVDKEDCDLVETSKCSEPQEKSGIDSECPAKGCGFIPDAIHCNAYKFCHNGIATPKSCTGDLLYDIKTGQCISSEGAACFPSGELPAKYNVTIGTIPEAQRRALTEPFDKLCVNLWKKAMTKIPYPGSCNRFLYCANGRAYLGACPTGLAFNSSSGSCDFQANVPDCQPKSEGESECLSRPCGVYPVSDSCDSYLICNQGRGLRRKCEGGFKFDTESGECQPPELATCWILPRPPTSTVKNMGRTFRRGDDEVTPFIPPQENPIKLCPYHKKVPSEPFKSLTNSSVLHSPNLTNFGQWAPWKECPRGTFVSGLQNYRRVAMLQGKDSAVSKGTDHAGITAMSLMCTTPEEDPNDKKMYISVVSPNLPERPWSKVQYYRCDDGGAMGFRLNQVPFQADGDNIATDVIKLVCSCGPPIMKPYQNPHFKEVAGIRGEWTEAMFCRSRQAICGFSAQVHEWIEQVALSQHDNTGINNIQFRCCNVPSPSGKYKPIEVTLLITTLDNSNSVEDKTFTIDLPVGLSYHNISYWNKAIQFYESIGYSIKSLKDPLRKTFATRITCSINGSSCLYKWDLKPDGDKPDKIWNAQVQEVRTVRVPQQTKLAISQVVGVAGPYLVRTERILQTVVASPLNAVLNSSELKDLTPEEVDPVEKIGTFVNPMQNPMPYVVACPYLEQKIVAKPFKVEDDGIIIASQQFNLGWWMEMQQCPKGMYVFGVASFRSLVEDSGQVDQAGLTSLAFLCRFPGRHDEHHFLTFTAPGMSPKQKLEAQLFRTCVEGGAVGFELNVVPDQGEKDDLATDNIRLRCSCGPSQMDPFNDPDLKAVGGIRGQWTGDRYCEKQHVICGLQAQMHNFSGAYDPNYDNTGLNGIRVKCCHVPSPVPTFTLREERKLLATFINTDIQGKDEKEAFLVLPIGITVGLSELASNEKKANFYDSLDYTIDVLSDEIESQVPNLAKDCVDCEYLWGNADPAIFATVIHHREAVLVPKAQRVAFYQIVAHIGYFLVRTNMYVVSVVTRRGEVKQKTFTVNPRRPLKVAVRPSWFADDEGSPSPPPAPEPVPDLPKPEEDTGSNRKPGVLPTAEVSLLDFDQDTSECKFHDKPPAQKSEKSSEGSGTIISSPETTNWGKWSEWQYCPQRTYVTGVTAYRDVVATVNDATDEVGLVAVGFICQDPTDETKNLKNESTNFPTLRFSSEGACDETYKWKKWYLCRPGSATVGLELNVVTSQGKDRDNVASDNVQILCSAGSDRRKPYDKLGFAGRRGHLGQWTGEQACQTGQAVCGVQVQMHSLIREANILEYDNTGVNNIKMKCCDVPPLDADTPILRREFIFELDHLNTDPSEVVPYTVTLEVGTRLRSENVKCFYDSIGYNASTLVGDIPTKLRQEGAVACPGKKCDVNFATIIPAVFGPPQLASAKQTIVGGEKVMVYQVVVDVGALLVKTNRYILITFGVDNTPKSKYLDVLLDANPVLRFQTTDRLDSSYVGRPNCSASGREPPPPVSNDGATPKNSKILQLPKITDWGEWYDWRHCPEGSFITGVQAYRRVFSEDAADHVGVISFGFQCSLPTGKALGEFGFTTLRTAPRNWTVYSFLSCKDGFGTGFQLNVMPDQGPGDDMATDNIRLMCSCGPPVTKKFDTPEASMFRGEGRGEWGKRKFCDPKQALCGARAQSFPYIEGPSVRLQDYDNTGINNIEMKCCDVPSIAESCSPTEKRVTIGTCDNSDSGSAGTCEFESYIGYLLVKVKDKRLMFYESLGFDLVTEVASHSHNLMVCNDCKYPWDSAPSSVWQKVKAVNRTVKISPYSKITLHQFIGECGFVQVRSNRYIIVEMAANSSSEKITKTWDVTEETTTVEGRTFGRREPKQCPFHGKPQSAFEQGPSGTKIIGTATKSKMGPWFNCLPGSYISGINTATKVFICKSPEEGVEMEYLGNVPQNKLATDRVCDNGAPAIGFHTLAQKMNKLKLLCAYGNDVMDSATVDPSVTVLKGEPQVCGPRRALCGVAKSEVGNEWQFKCCHAGNPLKSCTPSETRIRVTKCDNTESVTGHCPITVGIGVQLAVTQQQERTTCFYSSIGFDVNEDQLTEAQSIFENYHPTCPNCQYPWDEPRRSIWKKTVVGTYDISMHPNESAEVYQIAGVCGHIVVKTDRFVKQLLTSDHEAPEDAHEEFVYIK